MTLPEGTKIYLSKKQAAAKLGLTVRGLESLAKNNPSFPKPRVWGNLRQSRVRFLDDELDVWMDSSIHEASTV